MADTKLLVSVDYELFFGAKTGTVERSLVEPTEALAATLEKGGYKLSLFVDAGFLCAAKAAGSRHGNAREARDRVVRQLADLAKRGHDIQLHVHPHWQDCRMTERGEWDMRTQRYRLHDFEDAEIVEILRTYKNELESIKGSAVAAYRAGGWCMQPFERLAAPLRAAGIWIDSTVYAGGYSEVAGRQYDFRGAPENGSFYRFDDDPLRPAAGGYFLEIPISACRYGATAFWALAWQRVFTSKADETFGDGSVMPANSKYYLRRLTARTVSPVSIDRSKAGLLAATYKTYRRRLPSAEIFNVMGHPKSLTRRGLEHIRDFLARARGTVPATYADFEHMRPAA
jgi:hypothetical protein